MQKSRHSCKKPCLQQLGLFVNLRPVAEGGQRHPALPRCCCAGDCPGFPPLVGAVIVLRERLGWSAKPHALGFCRRNALCLTLADVGALVLRHKGQHLQDNIAEEGPHQVFAPAGVQERHVQYYNVNALLLGQNPPLFQNLPVVAPQPVDTLDVEQIVRLQLFNQLLILGPFKILAGLLVQKDVFLRDGQLPHGD